MPNTSQIIFLKGQLRDDISKIWFEEKTRCYSVIFKKGDNILHYKDYNVDIAVRKRQLEPPFRVVRLTDGEVFFDVLGVYYFEGRQCNAYRLIFKNGNAKNYPANYLRIEEHIDDKKSLSVLDYLNNVSKYNKIPLDDDKTISLSDKYAKLAFVSKGSLMEAYLNPETYRPVKRMVSTPLFPFGCNQSQYKAIKNALENNLSLIQGPPGTGKTQTILNIIANLLIDGKTIQVVSNNNSAVENVQEKLIAYGIDFVCAKLGNSVNKAKFIETQTGSYPDMSEWSIKDLENCKAKARKLSAELQELYIIEERAAVIREKIDEFKRQIQDIEPSSIVKNNTLSPKQIVQLLRRCSTELERKNRIRFLTKILLYFNRIPLNGDILNTLEFQYYTKALSLYEKEYSHITNRLTSLNEKNKELQELSLKVLKGYLYSFYSKRGAKRPVYSLDEIYLKTNTFLKEYPVILSTTFSSTSNINPNYRFDYLIMDEASQVDIAAGALALTSANHAVIVGDLKQLPNVVDDKSEETSDAVYAHYDISEAYRFSKNSFLSSVCKLFKDIPNVLLREHYRCDSLIIGFCNKQFYHGELVLMKPAAKDYLPVKVVKTVKGNHARGTINRRQSDTIINEVLPALEERFSDIGIIAPYNKQVDLINDTLVQNGEKALAATVHKFQGREKDAIILSTVDNQVSEFTNDPHLLNVAVSRAKKQFTLVVSSEEQPDSNIKDLIDYIEYYQGGQSDSSIHSIFDLLYESFTNERLEFLKSHKSVSEFDSENIAYWTINDVLTEADSNYKVLLHYPLRRLITNTSPLSEQQRKYASHSWTHLDFLIYNAVTHKAVLAIEVDGTLYHRQDSKQAQRDLIKNSVLEAIHLPLLRLSTDGSNEKEQIRKALGLESKTA